MFSDLSSDAPDPGRSHRLSPRSKSQSASSANFRAKPAETQSLINEALDMLDAFGIPMTATGRRRECMAMAFIAVAGVMPGDGWAAARDFEQDRALESRDIIDFRNRYLGESGSSGSYDDVRRRDLKPLVAAGIVVNSLPGSAHNAPNRGYALHPEFAVAVRTFGTSEWNGALAAVMENYATLRERLSTEREMERVPIRLASGVRLDFGPGAHNELQRAIVEQFLPRYGYGAEVLYIGDAEDKDAHYDHDRLRELVFFDLEHEELPDVVAFSARKKLAVRHRGRNQLRSGRCLPTRRAPRAAGEGRLRRCHLRHRLPRPRQGLQAVRDGDRLGDRGMGGLGSGPLDPLRR